jgi:hypothetical protein
VDQGNEQRSLRPRLRSAEEERGQERGGLRGSPRFSFFTGEWFSHNLEFIFIDNIVISFKHMNKDSVIFQNCCQ